MLARPSLGLVSLKWRTVLTGDGDSSFSFWVAWDGGGGVERDSKGEGPELMFTLTIPKSPVCKIVKFQGTFASRLAVLSNNVGVLHALFFKTRASSLFHGAKNILFWFYFVKMVNSNYIFAIESPFM